MAKKINFEHTRITARARALTLITDLRCFVKKIEKELNASDKTKLWQLFHRTVLS
jgi:hypothetical protein